MANEVVLSSASNVQQALAKNMTALKSVLPAHIPAEKMARLAMTQLRLNPALTRCKIESFIGAVLQSSALGLEIDSRQLAYLIPYGDEVNFQPGYRGLMQLFYNSSLAKSIIAEEVRENDTFEFDLTSGTKPIHKYDLRQERGEVIAYYCIAELTTGAFTFKVMTKKEVDKHKAKFSKAGGKSPWVSNYDSMALKTVIIKTLKFMPKSTELERLESAMYADNKVIKGYTYDEQTKQLDINAEFIPEEIEVAKEITQEAKEKLDNAIKQAEGKISDKDIEIEYVDILANELKEKFGLTIEQLEIANKLSIKNDKLMAKQILEKPELLKKYVAKAM